MHIALEHSAATPTDPLHLSLLVDSSTATVEDMDFAGCRLPQWMEKTGAVVDLGHRKPMPMPMLNPPHSGEFIRKVYRAPFGISPELSLRLSKVLGCAPERWLVMQAERRQSRCRVADGNRSLGGMSAPVMTSHSSKRWRSARRLKKAIMLPSGAGDPLVVDVSADASDQHDVQGQIMISMLCYT